MKETLARLVSNIFNPFLISAVVLVLLALKLDLPAAEAVKWVLLAAVLTILPVLIVIIGMVSSRKLDSFFNNTRRQRNVIYIFASVLGAVDCFIFWYVNAPELLAVTLTAGFIAVVVFMIINYFWKISLHTAFITAAVAVIIIVYGVITAWSLIFIPLVGWARIVLKQHSLSQVVAGSLLAGVIVTAVFWGFGMIG